MREGHETRRQTLRPLAWLILFATLSINALSAYIRHTEAGLGCADWPQCYGQIGELVSSAAQPGIARHALAPEALAKRAHRLIASALVVLVVVLIYRDRQQHILGAREAPIPLLMAALLLLLAIIGPASYLKTRPAIAACNLLGGIALAALAWRLLLGLYAAPALAAGPSLRRATRVALFALLLQLALGAWTSANFAGLACTGLAACDAPAARAQDSIAAAFWYFRELGLDAHGHVLHDTRSVAIHLAHRAGAVLATLAIAAACWLALRARLPRGLVLPVLALLVLQLALGALATGRSLPLATVLAHSANACFLLLVLLRLDHAVRGVPEIRT